MPIKESLRKKAEKDMVGLGTIVKLDEKIARYLMDHGVSREESWKFVGDELRYLQEQRGDKAIFGVTNERIAEAYRNMETEKGRELAKTASHGRTFLRTRPNYTLEKRIGLAVAVGSFLISAFYFSTNVTGFSIQNLNQIDTNIVGAIFFIMGITILMMELRRR